MLWEERGAPLTVMWSAGSPAPLGLATNCCLLDFVHGIPHLSVTSWRGFKKHLHVLRRLHVSYRDRYFEKQDIDASVEPLYGLVHLLADVAPFLLFVLRMDFYCLILHK